MYTRKDKGSATATNSKTPHFLIVVMLFCFGIAHAQSAGTISGNSDQLCVGSSSDYWSNGWGGGTWSSSNSAVLEVIASGSNARGKGVSAGTADVIYTLVANGSTFTARKTVTVNNGLGTISEISGVQPQCSNATQQIYSVVPVSNATSYQWKVPSGWSIVSGTNTNSIIVKVGTAGGNIEVSASNQCGTSAVMYKYINVNPTITSVPVTTNASNIQCKYAQLNWQGVGNADGYFLDISQNSDFTQMVSGYNNFYVPGNNSSYGADNLPAGVLYYRVRATNNCTTTVNSNTATFQTNAPLGGTVSAPQQICFGTRPNDLILTGHSSSSNVKIIRWEKASDLNFTNRSNIDETSAVLSGTKIGNLTTSTYFRAVLQNQFGSWCDSYSVPVLISVGANNVPAVTIAVSPSEIICAGSTDPLTFTATPTNGGSNPTYQWKVNGIAIENAQSATYTTGNLKANDVISVIMVSNAELCSPAEPVTSNEISLKLQIAVYDGAWSIPPGPNVSAEIRSAYNVAAQDDLKVCSLHITNNAAVTVSSTLTVLNELKVDAGSMLTILSDANLLQENNGRNTGNITVLRDIKIGAARTQYNYLGSPVEFAAGQTYKTIYPGIAFSLYHNEANNLFYNSSGVNVPGRGLAVKEPTVAGVPAGNSTVTAKYIGVPQNGTIRFPLANSNTATNTSLGYNLVGNPYPSNIDLKELYKLNRGNPAAPNISSTFYLWDNEVNNDIAETQQGSNYSGQAYAVFNTTAGLNGTGTTAAGYTNGRGSLKIPGNRVSVAQGFMVKANVKNYTLLFNNSVRTDKKASTVFLGKTDPSENEQDNRFWLKMITPSNLTNALAVVYFEGGQRSVGIEDSESRGGSDELYSEVDGVHLAINGREQFQDTDALTLGSRHYAEGIYTIELAEKEGIFANGQNIYLKDTQTGILTNLSQGSYSFTANAGESTGRFQIVYKAESVLVTESAAAEKTVIYRDANEVIIKSPQIIAQVDVYDPSGKLWKQLKPNQKIAGVDVSALPNSVYILKITSKSGEAVSRKFIR